MSELYFNDIFFRNFFDHQSVFTSIQSSVQPKISYPYDIISEETGITIEVPIPGMTKDDIKLDINGDIITLVSNRVKDEREYLIKRIAKRDFGLSWKLSSKLDTEHLQGIVKNGLLSIVIPLKDSAKPRTVEIQ